MTDKQIKEEIKQVVTNLGNIKFTVEDELEFCKKVLKRKEQECEELKKEIAFGNNGTLSDKIRAEVFKELNNENKQLKAENEVLEKVNKTNQEKIKKLNEQVEEEFIAQQYGDMALFWKVEDYKQALTEIKEIAETCNSSVSCSACPYTKECRTDLEAEALGVCKMVLKKCEVLDDICTNKG